MQHVLIIHEVDAYPAWEAVFDQAAGMIKNAGEISYQLLRYDNDANTIVHFSEWSSLDNARRFFDSPGLVEIRRKASVKEPDFIYLQEIARIVDTRKSPQTRFSIGFAAWRSQINRTLLMIGREEAS